MLEKLLNRKAIFVIAGVTVLPLSLALVRADTAQKPAHCVLSLAYVPDAAEPSDSYAYVLEEPGYTPTVYDFFDSKPMKNDLSRLPPGSALEYASLGLTTMEYHPPTEDQMEDFTAFCKKQGLKLVIDPTD